jgi:hypothetical protein
VQGLGAENHVHVRCPPPDLIAFLAGNATADADDQAGIFFFQETPATEFGKQFFLGFFADGAGVDENDIGIVRGIRALQSVRGVQYIQHLVRIVLIHLTAEGFYKEFASHALIQVLRDYRR